MSLKSQSTRTQASSAVFHARCALEDVCKTATWSTPSVFVKYYLMDVDATNEAAVENFIIDQTTCSSLVSAIPQCGTALKLKQGCTCSSSGIPCKHTSLPPFICCGLSTLHGPPQGSKRTLSCLSCDSVGKKKDLCSWPALIQTYVCLHGRPLEEQELQVCNLHKALAVECACIL